MRIIICNINDTGHIVLIGDWTEEDEGEVTLRISFLTQSK